VTRLVGAIGCVLPLLCGSCSKAPLFPVAAGFVQADAIWFAEEETLFLFADVKAEQGLGDPSSIEIRYTTDTEVVDWTSLFDLPMVHTHLPVDCGAKRLCGSASLHVPLQPRDVELRLRYHVDGELALDADTVFNVVGEGPPHTHRSLIPYGVFDESNDLVQWRGRHQFPTVRNEQARELGLRRDLLISDQRYGHILSADANNPYGYGATCGGTFTDTGFEPVGTLEAAVFNPDPLSIDAADHPYVCAEATVWAPPGTFTTSAIAQKNPEVRPAFPVLRSPVRDATQLPFFIGPCDRVINEAHEEMQRQRLKLEGVRTTCTEGWTQPGFVDDLVVAFRDAIEAERPAGKDMVLVIALHQDQPGVSEKIEEALAQVAPDERLRGSPRLAGAFVLDSEAYTLALGESASVTLWCPALASLDSYNLSVAYCAIAPDIPELNLGPFSFSSLPILPSSDQYLDFIEIYSPNQAGEVDTLAFRVPEFSATADHIGVGDIGAATFLNNEVLGADEDDAFSYCVGEEEAFFVFRSPLMETGALDFYSCLYLGFSESFCEAILFGLAPIEGLPNWHNLAGESSYELGMFWEFPYLLRMEYKASVAGAISAFGFSVPFGLNSEAESYYGSAMWTVDEFSLENNLVQCDRYCDHATFDSAGVYHVTDDFRSTYADTCYLPDYPAPGDHGFPLDP
jgi:hypothetical protein